jgi:hypothetical protein
LAWADSERSETSSKQGAAVGVLEFAAPPADAGCGPFLDAEQLGLEQCFNQGGAVTATNGLCRRRLSSWI